MTAPDFRECIDLEIEQARAIVLAASKVLPYKTGVGDRIDLVAALGHIAHEHVGAILLLFQIGSFASGYALMRPAMETAYKCIWIGYVADETQVKRAYAGKDVYRDLKVIIGDLESKFEGTAWSSMFAKIRPHIRALHERTHSGGEQTLRRLRAMDMRSPYYSFPRLLSDIRTLAAAAILVATPMASAEDLDKLTTVVSANYSWLAE